MRLAAVTLLATGGMFLFVLPVPSAMLIGAGLYCVLCLREGWS